MPNPLPPLLEPAELEALLGNPDLLVVDLCQPQVWRQLHVPGAVHVNPGELVRGTPPVPGLLPAEEQLVAMLERIGYSPDRQIVAYDDEGGGWAGRFLWTLDMIGHRESAYLNGGLHAWHREQHPVTDVVLPVTPTTVTLTFEPAVTATGDEVLAALHKPGVKIWDARSPEEFAGLKSSSSRAGHNPGAVNLDWLELMDRSRNLRLLPLELIQRKLQALGIRPGDAVITHCQSHHRSGLSYLVAKLLGYQVRAYPGSWAEWGNRHDLPIEVMA